MNTIIEKIRAEIERLMKEGENGDALAQANNDYESHLQCEQQIAVANGLLSKLSFLSDLEESEKPTTADGLEEEIERYQEEHFEYNSEFDSIRLKGDYLPSPQTLTDIARHFAKWQKEKFMKGAVEAVFLNTPYPTICLDDCEDYNFKDNQEFRIIIVKED